MSNSSTHIESASQPVRLTKFNILDWELDHLQSSIIEQETLMHRLLDELARLATEEQLHGSNDPSPIRADRGWYGGCGFDYHATELVDEFITPNVPTASGCSKIERMRSQNKNKKRARELFRGVRD